MRRINMTFEEILALPTTINQIATLFAANTQRRERRQWAYVNLHGVERFPCGCKVEEIHIPIGELNRRPIVWVSNAVNEDTACIGHLVAPPKSKEPRKGSLSLIAHHSGSLECCICGQVLAWWKDGAQA